MFLFKNEKYKFSNCSNRYFDKVTADSQLAESSICKYQEVEPNATKILNDMDVRKINSETITKLKRIRDISKLVMLKVAFCAIL